MLGFRGAAALFGGLAVAIACVAVACSVYDSSLLLPGTTDSGGQDVAEAAAPDVREAEAAPPPCPEDFPPSRPAMDDPSDAGDDVSVIVALHTIDIIGNGGPPSGVGYDIDNVWTCCDGGAHGGAESCTPPSTGSMHYCDENGGIDNNGGALLSSFATLDPAQFSTASISQRLEQGVYSILLLIQQYNGTANDEQVTGAIFASPGVVGDAGAMWNGKDSWTIDQNYIASTNPLVPVYFDTNAFVANGVLVMRPPNFPFTLGTSSTGSFTVSLTAMVVTAKVTPAGDGTYRMTNGVLAGRWNVSDLLNAIQAVTYQGQPICRGGIIYESLIKPQICQYADIMTDPMRDLTGTKCDGLSLAAGFTADPALMGPVVSPTPKTTLCEGGTEAGPDECP